MTGWLTFALSFASKVRWYLLGAGVLLAIAGGVLLSTYNSGAQHEELKQVKAQVKQHQKVQKIEAHNSSVPASDARKRLQRDWEQR